MENEFQGNKHIYIVQKCKLYKQISTEKHLTTDFQGYPSNKYKHPLDTTV